MRGRRGLPYGEQLPRAVVRALLAVRQTGMCWEAISDFADVHELTIRRALRGAYVTRITRDRLEKFLKEYG